MKILTLLLPCFILLLFLRVPANSQEYRSLDGTGNNLYIDEWGSAGTPVVYGTIGYSDGISEPSGEDWPNPRFISNSLFAQDNLVNDQRNLSAYTWVWGQFIDHDITLSPDGHSEDMNVSVPQNDIYFDPQGTGAAEIPMKRSAYIPSSGTDVYNPRIHKNEITAFIDASAVYGSDESRASWLRTYNGGKLKTSEGNLLPYNTNTGEYDEDIDPNAPEMAMPFPFVNRYFVAGDVRANENPFLTSMHTIFVREHNRLCDILKEKNPGWTDEQLYQHARKLVGGILQAIVFEEWLPVLGMEIPGYEGYDETVNPSIMNAFNTAAYRYGHTTITSLLVRMDNNGNYLPQGDILLRDAFFNPGAIAEVDGIESYLIGMATVVEQNFDCKVIDDLRNFLFGSPGSGGLDLVAININRGRDRGLPDFNTVRKDYGLEPFSNFNEISSNPFLNDAIKAVYGDINKIDPWVGMLSENQMNDALFGETAMTIIKKQFMALRDGDRFYYENDIWLSNEEKEWIKQTRLSDVIKRNTPITIIQDEIFMTSELVSSVFDDAYQKTRSISIYPNPVVDKMSIRIESDDFKETSLRILDIQGKTMLQRNLRLSPGNNIVSFTLSNDLLPGQYILLIEGKNYASQQFVKVD